MASTIFHFSGDVPTTSYNPDLKTTQKALCLYDISTRTLTIPEVFCGMRGLPKTLINYPESILEYGKTSLSEEAQERIRNFYSLIRRGDPSGVSDVYPVQTDGQVRWEQLGFYTIFSPEGEPVQTIISVDDLTKQREQSEENARLREDTRILHILAQHSGRTICCYDPKSGLARHWGEENCENCIMPHLCETPYREHLESGVFPPDSVETLQKMFAEVESGKASGNCMVQLNAKSSKTLWVDLKYSTVCADDGEPVLAIFSFVDATNRYRQELAYLRELQAVEDMKERYIGTLEVDLTEDRIDRQGGQLSPPGTDVVGQSFTSFGRRMVDMKFMEQDKPAGLQFFSSDFLLDQFERGDRHPSAVWQMRFRNGTVGWVRCEAVLLLDPYSSHIRALIKLADVSEEWETKISVQNQAWHDGMTGLLNRFTAEEQIRRKLGMPEHKGGVLILLDLDDLKTINDVHGHEQGDHALRAIAGQLKTCFRSSDIIGRYGGDEFILYLPDAAGAGPAISQTLTSMLNKLDAIPINGTEGPGIHCSVGCAEEVSGKDSFETLLRRADLALYHVKRHGKNGFAFFRPEMSSEIQSEAQGLATN